MPSYSVRERPLIPDVVYPKREKFVAGDPSLTQRSAKENPREQI